MKQASVSSTDQGGGKWRRVTAKREGRGSFEAASPRLPLYSFEAELAERKHMARYRITLKRDASYFNAANVTI